MKRRITLVLIIGAILLVSLHAMAAATVKDVSPDHWAYQSVQLMLEKGYLPAYEDNTFRGNEPVTRYQLAVAVARILDEISKGSVSANQSDIKLLRELALELREELVAAATKLKLFESKMLESDRERAVLREDLTGAQDDIITLTSAQQRVIIEVDRIIKDIVTIKGNILSAETSISNALADIDAIKKNIETMKGNQGFTNEQLEAITSRLLKLETSLNTLSGNLTNADAELVEELKIHEKDIADLKNDITVISTTLESSGAKFSEGLVVQETLLESLQAGLLKLKNDTAENDLKLADQITMVAKALAEKEKALNAMVNRLIEDEKTATLAREEQLRSDIENLREELASVREEHKNDIEAIKKENTILKVLIGISALIGILMK